MIITYTLDILFMCIFCTHYTIQKLPPMRLFFEDDYFEYKQPYVIFKIEHYVP